MLKKLLIALSFVVANIALADTNEINSTANAVTIPNNNTTQTQPVITPHKAVVNPANIGSKSGSNQIFGNPPVTGEKGQEYYTKEQIKTGQNQARIGSTVGSNQLFGNPEVTGKTGEKYYTKEQLANPTNDPDAPNSSKYGINGATK